MRIVADTNTVVSGLLWEGHSSALLDAAEAGLIQLFTSETLLAELEEVLNYPRLKRVIDRAQPPTTVEQLLRAYLNHAAIVIPADIAPTIKIDPDDDAVLAAAAGARADLIVSGDSDVLNVKQFLDIDGVSSLDEVFAENGANGTAES